MVLRALMWSYGASDPGRERAGRAQLAGDRRGGRVHDPAVQGHDDQRGLLLERRAATTRAWSPASCPTSSTRSRPGAPRRAPTPTVADDMYFVPALRGPEGRAGRAARHVQLDRPEARRATSTRPRSSCCTTRRTSPPATYALEALRLLRLRRARRPNLNGWLDNDPFGAKPAEQAGVPQATRPSGAPTSATPGPANTADRRGLQHVRHPEHVRPGGPRRADRRSSRSATAETPDQARSSTSGARAGLVGGLSRGGRRGARTSSRTCDAASSDVRRRPACARSTASTWPPRRASTSSCSARPAAARPRCCARSPGLEQPTAGDVLIDGHVVTGLPPRARKVAMVFQSYALYPHKTVLREHRLPAARRPGWPPAERDRKARWAAELLGIGHLLDRKPRQLSGGERQRVALARALVREPQRVPARRAAVQPGREAAGQRPRRAQAVPAARSAPRRSTSPTTRSRRWASATGSPCCTHGRVRQVGPPVEVYDDPADTFVATFIGSPPMNLVPRDGMLVGFRPEHLLPVETVAGDGPGRDAAARSTGSSTCPVTGTSTARSPGIGEPTRVMARLPATVDDADRRGRDARVRGAARPAALLRRRDRPAHRAGAGCDAAWHATARTQTEPAPDRHAAAAAPARRPRRRRWPGCSCCPVVVYILALVAVPFVLAIGVRALRRDRRRPVVRLGRAAQLPARSSTTRCSGGRCGNTFVFTAISMVLIVVLGKVLANILVADFRGKWVVRFLVLLPWTTPVALVHDRLAVAARLDLLADRLGAAPGRTARLARRALGRSPTCTGWASRASRWRRSSPCTSGGSPRSPRSS